jgi:undecaprenyl-diphosphatase
MFANPTQFDVCFLARLAGRTLHHPFLDDMVESAIDHNLLGGFCYAAALFVFWVRSCASDGPDARRRVLVIFVGSAVAIALTLVAGHALSWVPPWRHPQLFAVFAHRFKPSTNTNSFPSQSTALYSAVAAGVYSLEKRTGLLLWAGVALLVAIPRMYVGGHYPSDVLAGLVLGLAGYAVARLVLAGYLIPVERLFADRNRLRPLWQALIFTWILEVAVEFRDYRWFADLGGYLLRSVLRLT